MQGGNRILALSRRTNQNLGRMSVLGVRGNAFAPEEKEEVGPLVD